MTLLAPFALLWVLSIPILLWLWRLASSRRQLRVSSLIPFEHLMKRTPRRRTQLAVNLLFWLQLASLIGLTLTLAQPALIGRHTRVILAILDTSASMAAHQAGASAFAQAQHALLSRILRKRPMDQVFLMTTAPVAAVIPEPTSDSTVLARAIDAQRVQHLGGNLGTTVRLGRALLGREPDETIVATDEPRPASLSSSTVRWIAVGRALPNLAIVGLDAVGPLCGPSDAHVVVTIQSFSSVSSNITVTALQNGQRLVQAATTLPAHARRSVSLASPNAVAGWMELVLTGSPDALELDNRAWVNLRPAARLPVVVRFADSSRGSTVLGWLNACQALHRSAENAGTTEPHILITDQEDAATGTPAMIFLPPAGAPPRPSHWVVSADHPIGSYLSPVDVVSAAVADTVEVSSGTPVVSALIAGRKIPVVVADEREGRRLVFMHFDPVGQQASIPVILTFFNSLRWLMGDAQPPTTHDPLVTTGWSAGSVVVQRPDGIAETVDAEGGILRYGANTLAGLYRMTQGSKEETLAVNFFDPLESNTLDRLSTWYASQDSASTSTSSTARDRAHTTSSMRPLASMLMMGLLLLLLLEWRAYNLRGRATQP